MWNLLSISKILIWFTIVIMIGFKFSFLTRQSQVVALTSVYTRCKCKEALSAIGRILSGCIRRFDVIDISEVLIFMSFAKSCVFLPSENSLTNKKLASSITS